MQFSTIILAASVLSAPVPGFVDGVKTIAKKVGGAAWTGTKYATVGLVGGSAFAVGAVGTNRLLNRKSAEKQQPAPAALPPTPVATDASPVAVEQPVVQ